MIAFDGRVEAALANVVSRVVLGRRKATHVVAPDLVVKATARHKPRRNSRQTELVVTVGKPNYAERELIRRAKKLGEAFPLKYVQVKEWK